MFLHSPSHQFCNSLSKTPVSNFWDSSGCPAPSHAWAPSRSRGLQEEAPSGTPRCGDSTGDKVPASRTTVPRRYHRPRLDQHLPKQPASSAAASSPHGSRRRASGAAQGRRRGAAGAAGSSSLRRGAPHRPPARLCPTPRWGTHASPTTELSPDSPTRSANKWDAAEV